MYCENCGSFVPNGADHCSCCGRKIETEDKSNPAYGGKKEGASKSEPINQTSPETQQTPTAEEFVQDYDSVFHYDSRESDGETRSTSKSNSSKDEEDIKHISIASIILTFIFPLIGLCLGIAGYRKAKDIDNGYKWLCIASIILSALMIFL